jgi:CelD/BcsL family acetyltransferase involved in cellulose biosynthesis
MPVPNAKPDATSVAHGGTSRELSALGPRSIPAGAADGAPMSAAPARSAYRVAFLGPAESAGAADVRAAWERIAGTCGHPNAFFHAPAWWDYLQPLPAGERGAVAVVRADDGSIVGVVPVRTAQHTLAVSVRGRTLAAKKIRCVRVMGCEPALPEDEDLHVELMRALAREFPDCDCVLIEAARADSYVSTFVQQSQCLRQHASVYVRYGMTPHYVIDIPPTFDEYLNKFKSKVRYNLRRQVKRLGECGGGELELARVERADEVQRFLDEATEVEAHSWQYQALGGTVNPSQEQCDKLTRLADQEILRCYVLRCGDKPCAMVRGFQYAGVYYSWCGFDQRLADLSPGTVLLYLLIADLCRHRPPERLTFLWGDDRYKRLFATGRQQDATALVVSRRARLSTRLWVRAHASACHLLAVVGLRRDESRAMAHR